MDNTVEEPIGSKRIVRLVTKHPEIIGISLLTGCVLLGGLFGLASRRDEVASRMMRWRIYGQTSAIGLGALIAFLSFGGLHGTTETPKRSA